MEVEMDVLSHEIIGTYVCALTKAPDSSRPATVAALMRDIACFVNHDFQSGKRRNGRVDPVDALEADRDTTPDDGDIAVAEFIAHDGSESPAEDAMGTWQVAPFIFFKNVKQNATLGLVQHSSENVIMRLPEVGLLKQAEREASTLARLGDPEKFPIPPHYYRYFGAGEPITSMEVLASNIGYYVTASCR